MRKVVCRDPHAATVVKPAQHDNERPEERQASVPDSISSGNTTIIGDYIATGFDKHDKKWLVQAAGNATYQSVIQSVKEGSITVDRRYIFLVLGHNQIHQVSKSLVSQAVQQLVKVIRARNTTVKIFFAALLPHLVDNQVVKPLIIKMN